MVLTYLVDVKLWRAGGAGLRIQGAGAAPRSLGKPTTFGKAMLVQLIHRSSRPRVFDACGEYAKLLQGFQVLRFNGNRASLYRY